MKKGYEDSCDFGRRKNKANSKPIGGLWPEILSKPGMAAD